MSDPAQPSTPGPREHGDRTGFLRRIRERQGPPPTGGPHPPPGPLGHVPVLRYRSLDGVDTSDPEALLPLFLDAVRAARANAEVVERVDGAVPAAPLTRFLADHDVRRAVASREPAVDWVRAAVQAAGVDLVPYTPATAVDADLAITSATGAIATTGSVVVDSATAGSRAVSLLPLVHLCVVPLERLVATHAEVLRGPAVPLPSCRVVISGPSRTGDIEQRLTLGAHGPVALHVLVVR